jgi:fatty-acyl-CoA synthase
MDSVRTLPGALALAARANTGYFFVSGGVDTFRPYAALRDAALRVASGLRASGLRRGDLVALVLPDAEEFLTALLGASIAGVIPASLYPPASTSDLARYLDMTTGILRAAGARAVVTTAALAPSFHAHGSACPELSFVLVRADLEGPAADAGQMPSPDDIAFVQYTSGSTAVPKGVALTHANLSANINAINGPAGVMTSADDVGVSWLPLNHDMGLVGMALGALYASRPCVLLPPHAFVKRPAEWLRAMTRHRATVSFAPNFAYDLCVRRIKDQDLPGLDLTAWRIAGCGAEPIHAPTLDAFARKFSSAGFRATSFFPSYGLAEHVLAATFPVRDRGLRFDERSGAQLVSCGVPLPGHQVRVADDTGRAVSDGIVGEILLAGPSVMLGYYKQEALTADVIRDGWLRTGDLGYLSDGELFVCGRVKDIIIVNGRKYHPHDLEWAVDDLAGVRRGRVAAFGVVNVGRPDRVVIVAEPSGTVPNVDLEDSVRRRISDLFGLYVDDVVLVPGGTVGRTTSGKVQRSATKARYEGGELTHEGLRAEG